MAFGGALITITILFVLLYVAAVFHTTQMAASAANSYAALLDSRKLSSLCIMAISSKPVVGTPEYKTWLSNLNASAFVDGFEVYVENNTILLRDKTNPRVYAVLQLNNA